MSKLYIREALMLMLLIATVEARPLYRKARPQAWAGSFDGQNAGTELAGTEVGAVSGLGYYVQVGIGLPGLQDLLPPINTTYSEGFGMTRVFALNVTEGPDPSSTQLGYVRGYTIETSYTQTGVAVEVGVVSYSDGTLNGTVSIQGLIVNGTNEIAVVGGTGDFRGVRGYGIINFVNASGDIVLFRHELHFL